MMLDDTHPVPPNRATCVLEPPYEILEPKPAKLVLQVATAAAASPKNQHLEHLIKPAVIQACPVTNPEAPTDKCFRAISRFRFQDYEAETSKLGPSNTGVHL